MSHPSVEELSLQERVALVSGRDFWSTQPIERLGVPSIVLTDGPHGVRRQTGGDDHLGLQDSLVATCFPPAVAVGSSWDPTVAERIGRAVGLEGRHLGVQVVLGPGVNIKRSPLCGRNFEYYSEDPLVSGVLGAAHVRGQQSVGVGASVKHFAANNQETDRMRISAEVDERTLREIYLPAFERVVVEAAPATVMCAYNRVNGVPAAENHWLLTQVLREEWGYTGLVVSDWGAVADPVASLRAGLDLEMPGSSGSSALLLQDAVEAGELDPSLIDTAAGRVLALGAQVGEASAAAAVDLDAHHVLARDLATSCAVLLKNEGATLPLAQGSRVAVLGPFATAPRYQGGGSSKVSTSRLDTPLAALEELAPSFDGTVEHAPGLPADADADPFVPRQEAVALAADADVAIVFAGLAEEDESEGFDRAHIDLPPAQVDLIRAVAEVARRTVVVLSNGGVVSVEGWHDRVDAILEGFLLGQAGGGALADLLLGRANPSGRLAETIPRRLSDTASHVTFPGEQGRARYGEGVMVGYRWHETTERAARYPFGHGLSYTSFTVEDLHVEATGPDTARARLRVTNTGDRAGQHVVQLYVATSAGRVRRPVRELRAFTKVTLEPGAQTSVTFDLSRRAFAHWDVATDGWVVPGGGYSVQICQDAATVIVEQMITLEGDSLVDELTLASTVQEWVEHPVVGAEFTAGFLEQAGAATGQEIDSAMLRVISSMPLGTVLRLLGGGLDESTREVLEHFMARTRAPHRDARQDS